MKSLLGRGMALLAVPLALAFIALPAVSAASGVNIGGDAYYTSTGVVLTSSTSLPNGYSYLYVNQPAGTMVSNITNLSADFQMLQGDCGGGSPRFSVDLANGKSIFLYFGPYPSYSGCGTDRQATGNLTLDKVDTSQIGGTFYDTWADAETLAGNTQVVDVAIVVDSDWYVNPQSAEIFDFSINSQNYLLGSGGTGGTTHQGWVDTTTYSGQSCNVTSPYTGTQYTTTNAHEIDTPNVAILQCTYQSTEHPPSNQFKSGTTGCTTNYGDSYYYYTTENTAGLITLRCYARPVT